MDQDWNDPALPGVYAAGARRGELPRRLAAPQAPLFAGELTEYERVALVRLAFKDPALFDSLVAFVLSVTGQDIQLGPPDAALARTIDSLLVGLCEKCFGRVAFDREHVAFDWPPAAHQCQLRQAAPSAWGKP